MLIPSQRYLLLFVLLLTASPALGQSLDGAVRGRVRDASGVVVRAATRSGSNQFHGSAFEYIRNSVLDAKNFFDLPGDIPPFQRNQFGAAFGGPLRRNRSFFFMNYEALRERKAITSVATVPAASVRSRAVPAVVSFLDLYPLPNGPVNPDGTTASLTTSVTQPAREDFGLVRLDHRPGLFGGHTSLVARVSVQDSFLETPYPSTPVPGFPQTLPRRNIYSLLGATTAFRVSAVNEFHVAFNRTAQAALLPPPPKGLTLSPVPGRDSVCSSSPASRTSEGKLSCAAAS